MARKLGLRPVDTGVGISTTGKQDITYYIVDIVLTPEMVFKNVKIAGFPLQNHDVDFVIGMDIISKGTLLVKNNSGKTVVTFTVQERQHVEMRVIFMPILRKEEVKEHEEIIYFSANERKV